MDRVITYNVELQGFDKFVRGLQQLQREQVPFATMYATTLTAKQAQLAIQEGVLPMHFILRRKKWMQQGVRVEPATKAKLEAVVKDIHSFMTLQEVGGEKRPRYGKMLAIPLKRGGARPTPTTVIKKENLPGAVMATGRGFIRGNIMYLRHKHYKRAKRVSIVRGPGAMRTKVVRDKIVAMYALAPEASLKPRYEFAPGVKESVEKGFGKNFRVAFEHAVNTAFSRK